MSAKIFGESTTHLTLPTSIRIRSIVAYAVLLPRICPPSLSAFGSEGFGREVEEVEGAKISLQSDADD